MEADRRRSGPSATGLACGARSCWTIARRAVAARLVPAGPRQLRAWLCREVAAVCTRAIGASTLCAQSIQFCGVRARHEICDLEICIASSRREL
uniref:Uncharacterized protein n=1 Tax=Macrostomum lignano TaxID=282301 RepID=A0A1I8FJB2_9PLAT